MKSYMERKYYLRGLGIGIAVTAIIMGIAVSGKQTMTDEEVIAKARELGMVENTFLSDTLKDEDERTEEASVEDKGQETGSRDAVKGQENAKTAEELPQSKLPGIETAGDSSEESDKTDKNEDITSAAIKTITVTSGDGSYTVAKKLADVGVVTSAENFDNYLCQNGYDKKLRTGTFSIPADASDEQIARIVTGAE